MARRFGKSGATILAVIALFSTANSLLSNMTGASRVIYQAAREIRPLRIFSKIAPKRGTPVPVLLLCACCTGGFVLIGNLEKIALIANFFVFVTFLTVNITLIRLRLRPSS